MATLFVAHAGAAGNPAAVAVAHRVHSAARRPAALHLHRAARVQIASWNVNSIRARQDRVLAWLRLHRPDVLCMQETKVSDDVFPVAAFRDAGYDVALYGQKAYNGVAIATRLGLEDVRRGFDDGGEAGGARLLSVRTGGVTVYSAYVPNGQFVGSLQWDEKLLWFDRLRALLLRHGDDEAFVVGGDFNVAPEERDVHDPEFWKRQVLFHPLARAALQRLCGDRLVDTFRLHHQGGGLYSWWDYRGVSVARNLGLRIDLLLASPPLARRCIAAAIDREARQGVKPSDHAPILATFADAAS
jgi:exodeoxyribonuclease-3